jgi:DNA-binding transcriptional regulator PaaX
MVQLSSDDLNERLDGQMLNIERTSILLEDAKAEPGEMLVLDDEPMWKLQELLSAYETFLEHFKKTTEDTVATIRELLEVREFRRCETDDDADVDTEDDAE